MSKRFSLKHLALACALASCQLSPAIFAAAPDTPSQLQAVNEKYIWDLTDLYPSASAWSQAKVKVDSDLAALKKYQGTLGKNAKSLLAASDAISSAAKEATRLMVYATLKADEDNRIAENEERRQLAKGLMNDLQAAISWYNPEILAVGEKKIRRFMAQEPGLKKHQHQLEDVLRQAPHTLSKNEENILAQTGQLTDAPGSIYQMLANANLPWKTITLSDGKTLLLNQAGYTSARAAANRTDRKLVFDTFWQTWKDYEATLGSIMNAHIQGLVFQTHARHFNNSLERSLFKDNMPEAVYRTLVGEVNKGLPTLHRYFQLRKRMLGIKGAMGYYDIYPPLVQLDKQFSIQDSIALTRKALSPLGHDYLAAFDQGVASRWMHVFPQPGKTSGAYMFGEAYDVHPYVLLNHNNDYESASTFAHEYGHAVHSVLANKAQTFENANYSTFIAETASIMNEMLLQDSVLKQAQTPEEKLFYLGNGLETLRGTFFRQTMFAEFELKMNEAVEAGQVLTGEKLTQMYLELLKRYHGDAQGVVKIDDLYGIEWAYIPHFYYDFYVYQYATSIAAAAELSQKIGSGDTGARDRFITMLKAGGSDYPYVLMKTAGVDLASPEPYRALIARMDATMDEMEKILSGMGK